MQRIAATVFCTLPRLKGGAAMPSTKLIMPKSWPGSCCSAASMRVTSRTCCPEPRLRSYCAAANCSDRVLHYAAHYVRSSSLPRGSRFAPLSPPTPTHATGSLSLSDRDPEAQRHWPFSLQVTRPPTVLSEVRASKLLQVRQFS